MKLFIPDSPLMSFLSRVADIVILNVLWLVCCLPVITIGASTTAMYRVALNIVRDEGTGIVRPFFQSFKLNFKQATLIFLITLPFIAIVVYEFLIVLSGALAESVTTSVVFCLPGVLLAMILSYVYPLLAQFDNSIKNTLKNACLLAVGKLPYSILMAALNLSAVLLFVFATDFFFKTSIFWILIGGALVAVVNAYLLRKIFKKQFDLD